jgi:spore coat protein U-like protein
VVKRSGTPSNPCKKFHLGITTGSAGTFNRLMYKNTDTFVYNLYQNAGLSNILRDHPSVANANQVIDDSFSGNTTTDTVSLFMHYPSPPYQSTISAGLYSDTVTLKLYRGDWNDGGPLHDSLNLNPNLTVPTYIALSLVNSGGPFNAGDTYQLLDFSTLTTGEQLGFDIRVESNVSYNVRMSSANNGNLKRTGGSDLIAYDLKVNGISQTLGSSMSTPVVVASHLGTTLAGGVQHPVLVTIGNVANKTAGAYQDTITIETIAQ